MSKIVDIVNGNRAPFIATLSIIVTLIISSVVIAGKISDIEKSLKQYVDERVDMRIEIKNSRLETKMSVVEFKIDAMDKRIEKNQKEIIELIKEK